MSDTSVTQAFDDSARQRLLESVIADYIRACDAGTTPDRSRILEQHPELADDLRDFFAQRDHLNQLAQPLRGFGDSLSASIGPGKHISYVGDYELLEEVARGGMGVVYKAKQKTLGRIVAVKMMLTGRLANEDDVKRFQIEAQAAANLQHPHIVPIHEVGQHEGLHYFSMDFVEGRSLASLLRENVLPPKQAANIVRQIAEAIHYAHQQGTLHRDLKPSNVLMSRLGLRPDPSPLTSRDGVPTYETLTPRITDFGLAMRVEGDSGLTQTGQIVGTPSYMPPEQAQGKRSLIGPGSDVYSLGAILYECLTGRAPFRADSVMKTIEQVIHREAASPRLLNAGVPRDLETICLKCLEKEPHRRYGTAQLLADDLQRFLDDRPILARPLGTIGRTWRWCKRNPVAASILASVVLWSTVGMCFLWVLASQSNVILLESAYRTGSAQLRAINAFRKEYSEVADGVRHRGIEITDRGPRDLDAIPLPEHFTMNAGERLRQDSPGTYIRVFSDYPFPTRRDRVLDEFERAALIQFRVQSSEQHFWRIETIEARPSFRMATPERMEARCIACHNQHPGSPKTDWKVGDVIGVLEVISPLGKPLDIAHSAHNWTVAAFAMAGGGILVGLGVISFKYRK